MKRFEFVYLIVGLVAFAVTFHADLPYQMYWAGFPSLVWTVVSIIWLLVVGPWWFLRRSSGASMQDRFGRPTAFPYESGVVRIVFAFACVQVVAVATGVSTMTIYFAIAGADRIWVWDGSKSTLGELALSAGHAAAPGAIVVSLCLALPLYLVSRRQNWSSPGFYIAAGAAISLAIIVPMVVRYPDTLTSNAQNGHSFLLAVLLAGPLSAMTFWLIARPDRQQRAEQTG